MAENRSLHVSLTPELEELIRRKLASCLYGDASEVVREALRLLAVRDELDQLKLERLRAALVAGEQSGLVEDFSMDELMAPDGTTGSRRDRPLHRPG